MKLPIVSQEERLQIEAFLYLEARLADESNYDAWEALITDDMHYWVPKGKADYDPARKLSYINDNRSRVGTRIRQLKTGHRHAQSPTSPMRRVLSNIEILDRQDSGYVVAANFVLYEHAVQATHNLRIWAGRATYDLRCIDGDLKMSRKVIELVNSGDALPSLAFII